MRDDDVLMEDADVDDVAVMNSNDRTMVDAVMEVVELRIEEAVESGGARNAFEMFGEEEASQNGGVCRLPLLPSLEFQGLTPEDCHFRMAESQFLRMSTNRTKKVTKVEFIKNVHLEERFNRKREEFRAAKVPAEARFVFHGTEEAAIDRIAREGFKVGGTEGVAIRTGAVFGRGVYTASNPDMSMAYCRGSNMMLLSLALPGDQRHHNYGVSKDVLVFKDVAQLLPRYVVKLRCGVRTELRNVDEPSRCDYIAELVAPTFCVESKLQVLEVMHKIHIIKAEELLRPKGTLSKWAAKLLKGGQELQKRLEQQLSGLHEEL